MNKPLTLYLVRHAESHNNARPESQRVSDPALTELGLHQAAKLGDRLSREVRESEQPSVILCSPFLRTLQTIQPTAQRVTSQPTVRTNLFEAGGCYEGHMPGDRQASPGLSRAAMETQFPGFILPPDVDHNGWYTLDGFEDCAAASARAKQLTTQLIDEFYGTHATVHCMIHGDLIRLLLSHFCTGNATLSDTNVSNTSVTCLRFENRNQPPEVLLHDDASHLDAAEISH
jgi:2,3-bisphosphoglycerate-dependent phosphoglycerate mutase